MKSYGKELWFNIPTRHGFVDITSQVEACPHESEIQEVPILFSLLTGVEQKIGETSKW